MVFWVFYIYTPGPSVSRTLGALGSGLWALAFGLWAFGLGALGCCLRAFGLWAVAVALLPFVFWAFIYILPGHLSALSFGLWPVAFGLGLWPLAVGLRALPCCRRAVAVALLPLVF